MSLYIRLLRFLGHFWPAPGSEDTELGVSWDRKCAMERRKFTREFKLEAVRLIKDRGVSYCRHRRIWVSTHRNYAIG